MSIEIWAIQPVSRQGAFGKALWWIFLLVKNLFTVLMIRWITSAKWDLFLVFRLARRWHLRNTHSSVWPEPFHCVWSRIWNDNCQFWSCPLCFYSLASQVAIDNFSLFFCHSFSGMTSAGRHKAETLCVVTVMHRFAYPKVILSYRYFYQPICTPNSLPPDHSRADNKRIWEMVVPVWVYNTFWNSIKILKYLKDTRYTWC